MATSNFRAEVSVLLSAMRAGRLSDALAEMDSLPSEAREVRLAALSEAANLFKATEVTVRRRDPQEPLVPERGN